MSVAEEKKQPYVFISYSSKNMEQAKSIRSLLEGEGIPCWMAPDDIPVGSEYADVIVKALKECACLVLVLTQEAQGSKWVAKEIERAINYNKLILSAQLEELELSGRFEFYIGDRQIVRVEKLAPEDKGFRRIVAGIQALSGEKVPDSPPEGKSPAEDKAPAEEKVLWVRRGHWGEDVLEGRLTMTVPALAKTVTGYALPEFLAEYPGGDPVCAAEWRPDGPVELYCVGPDGKETPWKQKTDGALKASGKKCRLFRADDYPGDIQIEAATDEVALRLHREFRKGDRVVLWGFARVERDTVIFQVMKLLRVEDDGQPLERPTTWED